MTPRHSAVRSASFGLAALALACIAALPAAAAEDPNVPVLGKLAIKPGKGDLQTPITMISAGGCPAGTNILVRIYGAGFPAIGENVVGNSETWEYGSPPADRMEVPMTITLEEAVRRQPAPVVLDGEYRINLICRDPVPLDNTYEHGDFVGYLTFEDGRWTADTTEEDLPDPPSPPVGQEAKDNPRAHQGGGPEPEELAEAAVRSVTDRPTAGASSTLPLLLTGGGVAGALGLLYVVGRGRPTPTGSRRR